MPIVARDKDIFIQRLELGPWGTNAYIVTCPGTKASILIDAPAKAGTIMDHIRGTTPQYIILTHNHRDHWGALAAVCTDLKVPLAVHALDAAGLPCQPELILSDGDQILCGNITLGVWHTPGHTPGSICLRNGIYLIAGDTIFPGGPGKTSTPDSFRQIVQSIREKILVLPDDTQIYPGHGDPTTVKQAKAEYAIFAKRTHDPGLCGDVLWLKS